MFFISTVFLNINAPNFWVINPSRIFYCQHQKIPVYFWYFFTQQFQLGLYKHNLKLEYYFHWPKHWNFIYNFSQNLEFLMRYLWVQLRRTNTWSETLDFSTSPFFALFIPHPHTFWGIKRFLRSWFPWHYKLSSNTPSNISHF